MSEGPIKRWRDGYKVPRASSAQTTTVHGLGRSPVHGYCGRKSTAITANWAEVTCADCNAALVADIKRGSGQA